MRFKVPLQKMYGNAVVKDRFVDLSKTLITEAYRKDFLSY